MVWERAYAPINLKKTLSKNHDYILVYAKTHFSISFGKLSRTSVSNARYKNPDTDPRGLWMSDNLSVGPAVPANIYPIYTPSGREVWPPSGYSWRLSKKRLQDYLDDNRIWFGKDGNNVPRIKRFLSEVKSGIVAKTLWNRTEVGDTQESKRESKALNPDDPFPTPKPERLLQRIIHLATNPGDIVLDSFAGSGTTGAVAHKMDRRWIMIELGDHCHTHIIPRMKKVIDGKDAGGITDQVGWKGGGGFRYYEMASSLLEKNRLGRWSISKEYNPAMLSEAVCMHAGYRYDPKQDPYWIHGSATERDFIYVTPQTLPRSFLARLSSDVGENQSLMVYCAAFHIEGQEFDNLTVRKIPKTILKKCSWGRDDYQLKNALMEEVKSANCGKRKSKFKMKVGGSV